MRVRVCVYVLMEWSWENNIEKCVQKKTNNKKALGGHRFRVYRPVKS